MGNPSRSDRGTSLDGLQFRQVVSSSRGCWLRMFLWPFSFVTVIVRHRILLLCCASSARCCGPMAKVRTSENICRNVTHPVCSELILFAALANARVYNPSRVAREPLRDCVRANCREKPVLYQQQRRQLMLPLMAFAWTSFAATLRWEIRRVSRKYIGHPVAEF